MATKCYTDAEIAAIIAAASGGSAPEIQTLALIGETDSFGNTRELNNRAAPGMSLAERLIGGNRLQSAQLSPAARLALAPTLSEWDRNQFLSGALFEKYPELFTTIPPRQNNTLGPPVGGTTPVLGAPTPGAQPQPTNGTTQAGPPDAIFTPGQPVPTNGNDMNGFSCPSPSAGTCFSDIPRADVSEIVQFSYTDGSPESVVLPIDLDNVRGMHLCSISGIFGSNGPVAPELYQSLFFFGTYTLHFRGQTVPGWTDRPLSEILSDPGCCDPEVVEVNCLIPEYGGLEMEVNLNGFGPDPDVTFSIATRLKFSGCGCSSVSHGGCGCGGGSTRRRIE